MRDAQQLSLLHDETRRLNWRATSWYQRIHWSTGRCPCGRTGRLYGLHGQQVCGDCLQAAEREIARQVEDGYWIRKKRKRK